MQQIIIFLSFCMPIFGSIKWLGITRYPVNAIWNKHDACTKTNGFTWKQVKFCRQQFPWMFFTQDAAKDTVDECQAVLKQHDWNCQSISKAPTYNDDLKKDTKESAFVHALSSSALALTVARGCMAGKLEKCTCQHRKQQASFPTEFVDRDNSSHVDDMVGCKGIMQVGQKFSFDFMNAGVRWKPKTERHKKEIAIRKHNFKVGLMELNHGEHISCTCNGATAGCTMKFCHRRLVLLQDVSNRLLSKYNNARKVEQKDFMNLSQLGNKGVRMDLYTLAKRHEKNLVFLEDVNHCNINKGRYGSTGRRCSDDNSSVDSCNRICCGKGHRIRRIEIHSKCKCRFVYCCKVKCETCKRYDTILECL